MAWDMIASTALHLPSSNHLAAQDCHSLALNLLACLNALRVSLGLGYAGDQLGSSKVAALQMQESMRSSAQ